MKNSPKESLESHLFKEGCPTMYLAVYCWPRAKHIQFFPLQTRVPSYSRMDFYRCCFLSGAPLPIQVFRQKHRNFFSSPLKTQYVLIRVFIFYQFPVKICLQRLRWQRVWNLYLDHNPFGTYHFLPLFTSCVSETFFI